MYPAALGHADESKGISLRFPRFIRIRTDKTTEESTSPRQLSIMYRSQDPVSNDPQPSAGGQPVTDLDGDEDMADIQPQDEDSAAEDVAEE